MAAYDSVYAWDEVVRRAEEHGELKGESSTDLTKKLPIPPVKKELLDAAERYLKYLPKGEKRVEVAYKAARIYYEYHRYDEAVFRFSEIALSYPDYKFDNGDRAGEIAANLVLDSYNGLGNYQKVNEWARRFYANDKLATGKFREDLSKIIEQSLLQAGGPARAEGRVRPSGRGLPLLRQGLPTHRDCGQGALQRLRRLLQSPHV